MRLDDARWDLFKYTMAERNAIYYKKEILHLPQPWTEDPVLKTYRFCNVFRDLDKVYRLLGKIPRDAMSKYYWATRLMLRWSSSESLIMWAHLHDMFPPLLNGDCEEFVRDATTKFTGNFVTGSFIVKRPGGTKGDQYMLRTYYNELVKLDIPSWKGKTIKECGKLLRAVLPWCGTFTSYCLLSDLMYEDGPLAHAPDLYTFAEQGPGAIRGMAILFHCAEADVKANWNILIKSVRDRWEEEGQSIYDDYASKISIGDDGNVDAATTLYGKITKPMALDVEHWLCEYAKYVRGTAKRKYNYDA